MAIYHLNVKTGTRIGGQSALAKSDYIGREGKYEKDGEELEYKESGNMPEWAEDDPRGYTGRGRTRTSGPTGGSTARSSSPYLVS